MDRREDEETSKYLSGPRSRRCDLATLCIFLPKSMGTGLSAPKLLLSHAATQRPTQTDSLIRGDKEIGKGLPLMARL